MEKRVVSFVILAMAILLAYQALEMRLNPPPAEPLVDAEQWADDIAQADATEDDAIEDDATEDDATEDDATEDDATTITDASTDPDSDSDPKTDSETGDGADSSIPASVAEVGPTDLADDSSSIDVAAEIRPDEQWMTLGTLDHARPEKMLVWFTNRGAAIECIALNDSRYTDLDDRHGYPGYLALRDTPEGCRIGAVGDGTPAANAVSASGSGAGGLQAGDILQQVGETVVSESADYRMWVETTKPAQEVGIRVRRQRNGQWRTLNFTVTLDHRPLQLIRPEPDEPSATKPRDPFSYLLGLQQLGEERVNPWDDDLTARGLPSLKRENWEMRQVEHNGVPAVEFHFVLTSEQLQPYGVTGPLRIIKRFSIGRPAEGDVGPKSGFHLNYEVVFRNEATDGDPIKFAYQQNGPTGLPLEGWWYTYKTHPRSFGSAGVRDVVFKVGGERHEMLTNPKIVARIEEDNPTLEVEFKHGSQPVLEYFGVDSQYFTSALLPDPQSFKAEPDAYRLAAAMALAVSAKDPVKASRTNVSFRLIPPVQSVAPNHDYVQKYLIFAGPKHPDVLKQYGMSECITYGWFRVVAKPLQSVLHAFYKVFRNYGIAIILLTVTVRGLMFPIGRQQVTNAQKMQELAPEMRQIAEKYKKDMEKRAAAQRELFRKHNYNPMAGCLPMFFQLPIFIGLYRALSVDIELRQAALIPGLHWCSNLAGPDQLWYWGESVLPFLTSKTGFLGPYLNILPLISVAFMLVHQKMFTPPPTDDQQEMQQKMMKFMMIFFAFMFFRVPAGLCLYFITSSVWGLAERKLLPNKAKTKAPADGGTGGGAGGLLKKAMAAGAAKADAAKANGAKTAGNKRRPKGKRR